VDRGQTATACFGKLDVHRKPSASIVDALNDPPR
jgi:hypothetical protein